MKILGLDLGTASIGWAVIETSDNNPEDIRLLGLGSRIVQYENKEVSDFSAGKGETPCSERTTRRTARKMLDRFQQRRNKLNHFLTEHGFIEKNEKFPPLNPLEIWKLRSDASTKGQRLSKSEIARILLHVNQRRGYRHSKSDNGDSKQTEYVARVNKRFAEIREHKQTVGQYLYSKLKKSELLTAKGKLQYTYRIKEKVFPREAYVEEFDAIMSAQREFYPDLLSSDLVADLKNGVFI